MKGESDASCLVVKNDGIGDLVLASGVLASLARAFDGRLDLVTTERCREVAAMLPGVRTVFHLPLGRPRTVPGLHRLGWVVPRPGGAERRLRRELMERRYTVALCLRRFIRRTSFVLMSWCRAGEKHGCWQFPTDLSHRAAERASRGWHRYRGPVATLSEASYFRGFVEDRFGVEVDPTPRLELPELPPVALDPGAVGLCIGGGAMNWPTGHWLELVAELRAEGRPVHLFGGPDAAATAATIRARHPGCTSHVGELGLAESVPYLRSLDAFVGNDTGFTHFASLVVDRCLVLLGGGTFGRFFPWPGADNQRVVYHGLDCFDCDWRCKFAERYCLTRLHPAGVWKAFQEMVRGTGERAENLNPEDAAYRIAWKRGAETRLRRFSELRLGDGTG